MKNYMKRNNILKLLSLSFTFSLLVACSEETKVDGAKINFTKPGTLTIDNNEETPRFHGTFKVADNITYNDRIDVPVYDVNIKRINDNKVFNLGRITTKNFDNVSFYITKEKDEKIDLSKDNNLVFKEFESNTNYEISIYSYYPLYGYRSDPEQKSTFHESNPNPIKDAKFETGEKNIIVRWTKYDREKYLAKLENECNPETAIEKFEKINNRIFVITNNNAKVCIYAMSDNISRTVKSNTIVSNISTTPSTEKPDKTPFTIKSIKNEDDITTTFLNFKPILTKPDNGTNKSVADYEVTYDGITNPNKIDFNNISLNTDGTYDYDLKVEVVDNKSIKLKATNSIGSSIYPE